MLICHVDTNSFFSVKIQNIIIMIIIIISTPHKLFKIIQVIMKTTKLKKKREGLHHRYRFNSENVSIFEKPVR